MAENSRTYELERGTSPLGEFNVVLATEGEASDGHILSISGGQVPERMPLQTSHINDPTFTLGSLTNPRKWQHSLRATARINLNGSGAMAEMRRGIAQLVHDGDLRNVSVRWEPLETVPRTELPSTHAAHVGREEKDPRKRYGLYFSKWRALEGSIVAVGADPNAIIQRAERSVSAKAKDFFRALAEVTDAPEPEPVNTVEEELKRIDLGEGRFCFIPMEAYLHLLEESRDAYADACQRLQEAIELREYTENLKQPAEPPVSGSQGRKEDPRIPWVSLQDMRDEMRSVFGKAPSDTENMLRLAAKSLQGVRK